MLCIFHRHLSYSNTYNRLKINRLHNTDCILSKKLESNRKDDLNVNIWTVSVSIFCCINEKGEINENISFFQPSFISATVKMTCSAVSLPSEIVSNIAQYLEQHLLHNCVLVCQNWRPIFERILYRHPSLSSEFAIDNFISTIRQRASCSPGTSSAAARHATGFDVRSMALETSFISMQQTRTLFQQCPYISALEFHAAAETDSSDVIWPTADMPSIASLCFLIKQLPSKKLSITNVHDPQCVSSFLTQCTEIEQADISVAATSASMIEYLNIVHLFCTRLRWLNIGSFSPPYYIDESTDPIFAPEERSLSICRSSADDT